MFGLTKVVAAIKNVAEAWNEQAAIVRQGNDKLREYFAIEDKSEAIVIDHDEQPTNRLTTTNGKSKRK